MDIVNDSQFQILSGLNERQRQAVLSISGSTLVIAGAGSGKTAVLTRRVAYLIAGGEIPGRILCLTFTNKAAKEMNERVRKLLQENGINMPWVPVWKSDYQNVPLLCTFHALGVKILREFGSYLNLSKDFNILDSQDQKSVLRSVLKDLNVDQKNLQPSLAGYFISQCKQELLKAEESKQLSKDFLPIFHQIYKKYEETLNKSQSVDFDDLIFLTYLLLRDFQEVRQTLQNRWHHVLVDEFQDTNQPQFEIIKLLVPPELI